MTLVNHLKWKGKSKFKIQKLVQKFWPTALDFSSSKPTPRRFNNVHIKIKFEFENRNAFVISPTKT